MNLSSLSQFGSILGRPFRGTVLLLLILGIGVESVFGQREVSRVVPRDSHFLGFHSYFDGDYDDALRSFRDAARDGIRSTEGRWIDSICYHTMMGECYYKMGQLDQALEQYSSGLQLLVAHKDWLLRIQFPANVGPSASVKKSTITWGVSKRRSALGRIPETMLTSFGRLNNEQALRRGGVVRPPEYFPVRVSEIVRCSVLAIRRRHELMGPASPHDELTRQVFGALMDRPARVNHWSQGWIDAQLGLAYSAAGQFPQAVEQLNRAIVVDGQYDHILTSTVLLELGKLALRQEKFDIAADYFLEATYAAVPFSQPDVMEEAFRLGALTHLVSNGRGVYPPLLPAVAWARTNRFRDLQASLLLLASEGFSIAGDMPRAATLLSEARSIIARRTMREGRIGARFEYQTAAHNFQQGKINLGRRSLASTMKFQRNGSLWLFHLRLVDQQFQSKVITPRIANSLFAKVLREPTAADWLLQPTETLSYCMTPHVPQMENWLMVAQDRKEHDLAIEIADRIRRHRFLASLPLGGRLLALRWVLEASENSISKTAKLQRQDILARYPAYAELSRQAGAVYRELGQQPLLAENAEDQQALSDRLSELSQLSQQQEVFLWQIALRREAAEFAFPPLYSADQVKQRMSRGQVVLGFFGTQQGMFGFALSKEKYSSWPIKSPAEVRKTLVTLLREMGHVDRNSQLPIAKLKEDGWREHASKLAEMLIKPAGPEVWNEVDELIIVPEGLLWLVPFEALPVVRGSETESLLSVVPIRFAPTLSLAVPDQRRPRPTARTAVVAGKLYNREDDEISQEAMSELLRTVPGSSQLETPLPAPSAMTAKFWDRLIVMDDVDDRTPGPYDWSPAQIDRGKAGSALADWFQLPWGAPPQILLPGFHTPAESALKRSKNAVGGSHMFLSVCGLMSTGANTILISRWRPGGQNHYDLIREFAQELPHGSPSAAWQRSVTLARQTELDPEREPRIRPGSAREIIRADHPFFWAGHMLVDTGSRPIHDDQPPQAALK